MTDQIETNKRGLLAGALTLAAIPAVGFIGSVRAQTADGGIDPTSALAKVRQSGTLKMGYAQTAPWFFKDPKTGDLGGIYYDIAEALAAALQVKSAYQEVSWSDSTPALRRGDFDIFVSSLTYTVPRAASVAFPTPPLWARGSLALIHKDNAGKFKTAADLNSPDVTIAVNTGTSAEAQQKRLFPKAKVLATTGQILSATEPVRSKRADAWLNGDNDVIAFAHKNAAWAAVLDAAHPFDMAPNTWAVRYGDPAWETFIMGWCNYALTNGLVKDRYDHYMALAMQ
ncbi:MAG TPA: transporter substrate-binding domain-containing protein [Acetobacteraceae bacterium]|jgi:polar amino acid transport system substrate-binding protein|nr:transporter substrate-binding domain-containing protein [Acetobacteraceae bacterium]